MAVADRTSVRIRKTSHTYLIQKMRRPALTVARFDTMNSDSNVNDNKKDNDILENATIRVCQMR